MISRVIFAAAFVAACSPVEARLLTPDLSSQPQTNEPAKRPLVNKSTPAITILNIIAFENVMKDADQRLFGKTDGNAARQLLSARLRHYNMRRNACGDNSNSGGGGPFFVDQTKLQRINIIKSDTAQFDASHAKVHTQFDLVIEDNGPRFNRDMTYDLVYEDGAWKLDDIEYPQQDPKGHSRNTYRAFVEQLCTQAGSKRPSATADRLLSYSAPSSGVEFPTTAPQAAKLTKAPRLKALLRAAVRSARMEVERADEPRQPRGVMMLKVRVSAHGSDLENVRLEALPGKPAFSSAVQSAILRNAQLIKFDSPDGQAHAYESRIVWQRGAQKRRDGAHALAVSKSTAGMQSAGSCEHRNGDNDPSEKQHAGQQTTGLAVNSEGAASLPRSGSISCVGRDRTARKSGE